MDKESVKKRILYLREVEKLSLRQIADTMNIDRKRVSRILQNNGLSCIQLKVPCLLEPYRQLIIEWYRQFPKLKATQIYQRLKSYGYKGSYSSVVLFSKEYRQKKKKAYHILKFSPGEEAQIDWFFFNHETLGKVAGFLYLLSYSRYTWGMFYPKTTFEFFLAGHIECFEHLNGIAHRHRYDNLKSVVLKRRPEIEYNPQFLDFAGFHGFSIYLCNPYKGNEKGRVERVIRDIRVFLYGETFSDLNDLNRKFHLWLKQRNERVHRSTGRTPEELLIKEPLLPLPQTKYLPTRTVPAAFISKTAFIEFDSNKYSLPTGYAEQIAELIVFPDKIEVHVNSQKAAVHQRSFKHKQVIQNPLHAEALLKQTPQFKMQRILQLMQDMDPALQHFLHQQDDETQRIECAYQLFKILRSHSKIILCSAVRELNQMRCYQIKALRSLLNLPAGRQSEPVWPQNTNLLDLDYEQRRLEDYDKLT